MSWQGPSPFTVLGSILVPGTVNRGGQAPALGEFIADKWTVIKYANTHRGLIVGNATEGGWCRVRAGAVGSRVSGQGGGSQQRGDA